MSEDESRIDEVVMAYSEAWHTPDEVRRRELLERSFAGDGTYTDPACAVSGRDALSTLIGDTLRGDAYDGALVGARILGSSGLDHHHGMLRFSWMVVDSQGQPALAGMDFVELAADGRLQRITGFFGPLPPAPDSWPEHLVWREGLAAPVP